MSQPQRPQDRYGFDTSEDQASLAGYWSWFTATLFVGFASILILFPRLLVFLAEVGRSKPDTALTPLESFLALHFGIFLISVSTSIVLNTQAANAPVPSQTPGINHALLVPISCGSVLSAFLAYNAHKIGPLSDIVFFITGLIGVFGLWTSVFADPSPTSKKTGADKHTSSLIFGNSAAASKQKEKWRAEHKDE